MKENITYPSVRSQWNEAEKHSEHFDMPSMVEPVHNLSLQEILENYSRGILPVSQRQAFYDDGDDITPVQDYDDISEVVDHQVLNPDGTVTTVATASAGAHGDEVGKPSEDEEEKERSDDDDEASQDPGPKEP